LAVESNTDEYDKFDSIDKGYRIKYVASHSNTNENGEGLRYTTEELAKQDLG